MLFGSVPNYPAAGRNEQTMGRAQLSKTVRHVHEMRATVMGGAV
jgi:hypothetical protein